MQLEVDGKTEVWIFQRFLTTLVPQSYPSTLFKPDLVLINYSKKEITLIEHADCLEANMKQAQGRKLYRYESSHDLQDADYHTPIITIEIGSRCVL